MPYNCPHCSVEIEDVVPKSRLDGKTAEHQRQVEALNKRIEAAQKEGEAYGKRVVDLEGEVQKTSGTAARIVELERQIESRERLDALRGAGVTDEAVAASIQDVYGWEMGKRTAEDARPTFSDWLANEEGARAHPLLRPHFTAPAAGNVAAPPGAPAGAPPAPAAPAGLPSGNAGAGDPPPQQRKMNAQQLRQHFRSPTFLALPAEQQRAERQKLEAEYLPS